MELLKRFIKDEQGLETVEYAVITGLIVVAAVTAISLVGPRVAAAFNTLLSYSW
jgi:Flp pilus assembly pilin Flp